MRKWYDSSEAANLLGIHPETIRHFVREGRLDCGRVGRHLRFSEEMLDAFVKSGGKTGNTPSVKPDTERRGAFEGGK